MKNFRLPMGLASAALLMSAFTANAQWIEPKGVINLEEYTKGLNAFNVIFESPASINRDAEGYIEVKRNGELYRQIPAQNANRFYMLHEFDMNLKKSTEAVIAMSYGYEGAVAGTYSITIPAGFFVMDGQPVGEMTGRAIVPENDITPTTPSSSEKVEDLYRVVYTFPEGSVAKFVDQTVVTKRTNPNNGEDIEDRDPGIELVCSPLGVYVEPESVDVKDNTITLTFAKTYASPGYYYLNVKSGSFSYELDGKTVAVNGNRVYHVTGYEVNWEINPKPGTYTEFASHPYTVTKTVYENNQPVMKDVDNYYFFAIDVPLGANDNFMVMRTKAVINKINEDGTIGAELAKLAIITDPKVRGRVVLVDENILKRGLEYSIEAQPGEYVLTIPEGTIRVNGISNPAANFYYTIEAKEGAKLPYVIYPAENEEVKEIDRITITYPEGTTLDWNPGEWSNLTNGICYYAFKQISEGSNPTMEYFSSVDVKDNVINYHLSFPIVQEGIWTLDLPNSVLSVNGKPSSVHATFKVGNSSGVNAVEEATNFTVVAIDGRVIAVEAPAMPALQPGLYIINGKKVLVK